MLEIRNVTKSYDEKAVLSSVCFTLLDGESLLLAGETGGGKTTLARIICGSQCPDSGEVLLDGKRLLGTYRKRSPEELADIQYIFQDPYSAVELTNTLRQTLDETERVMKRHGRSCLPMRRRFGRRRRNFWEIWIKKWSSFPAVSFSGSALPEP